MRKYDEIITYRPIGFVENASAAPVDSDILRTAESRIVLDPALAEGLTGVEPGQNLMVVFHFHLSSTFELHQHPGAI